MLFLYFYRYFFSIGNKESARNGYSFACPFILCPTFSPTPIIYEHIHAIVFLLSVYLQFSIHFNLWFCVIQECRSFFSLLLLLKMIKQRKRNCNYLSYYCVNSFDEHIQIYKLMMLKLLEYIFVTNQKYRNIKRLMKN